MLDLPFRSAGQLAAEIRRKAIGASELLELFLKRVDTHDPRINAIVATALPEARARAKAADEALARGEVWGPLHGVPMTVKESFDVVGMPTTWGVPELKDNRPARNALAVDRFLAAGAIVLGKTNVPLYLADWQTFNAIYGTTSNPWDLSRSPGGSSGGSAAALAAGLTGLEAGSDIGASIRNPAHYCGVWGHKPTWGICPPRGQAMPGIVAPTDISVIGPLARSADDLELAVSVMAGPNDIDGAGWRLALPPPRRSRPGEFKVAVMLDDPCSEVDTAVQDRIAGVAELLGKAGARVSHAARPAIDTAEANRVYIALLRAATSGRQTDAMLAANLEAAARLDPADESYLARMVRANVMPHRDWLGINNKRHHMRLAWAEFFREWDVLICPAAASAAFPHDHEGERHERTITVNGRQVPTTDQLFWAGFSGVAYLPSTVAPAGFTPSGLPVGVQIVGPQYGDLTCIALARLLERELQGFVAPPGFA
ncbi:MAG: amidase [Hyphomicrobiaceae bacterium]|nr:amidase [Hyphomicrobiaceae bacterium]